MHRNQKITDVNIDETEVAIKKYTQGIWQPFHKDNPSLKDVYEFLEDRCYENGRVDLKDILALANLKENNPWEWIRLNHGVTYEDDLWICFDGEELMWEEVKVR
jgi:hypothetical protein